MINLFRNKNRLPDNWKPERGTKVRSVMAYALTEMTESGKEVDFYHDPITHDVVTVKRGWK